MAPDAIQKLKMEINNKVRTDVGAFCTMVGVIFMKSLPKTRSGKILRGTIRNICNRNDWKMPATIDDVNSLKAIQDATDTWMATLPADRRIESSSKYISGFEFVRKNTVGEDGEEEKKK